MTYTYCGITADAGIWRSLGIQPSFDGRTFPGMDAEVARANGHSSAPLAATDGELIEARATTNYSDERALAWLLQERRRQNEERARNAATIKAADEMVHAARIQRQAAMIRARVAKVEIDISNL